MSEAKIIDRYPVPDTCFECREERAGRCKLTGRNVILHLVVGKPVDCPLVWREEEPRRKR